MSHKPQKQRGAGRERDTDGKTNTKSVKITLAPLHT